VVLASRLLRLHGAGVEIAESVFNSDDMGTFVPYQHKGALREKKVELPLGLSRRVHLRRVLFCFDALIFWIG